MMILGVYREHLFSPGRVDDDALILEETLKELSFAGHEVRAAHVEDLDTAPTDVGCVVTMAESPKALAMFEKMERRGTRIINGVDAIRNCHRTAFIRLLSRAGLPMPKGWIVPAEDGPAPVSFRGGRSYWLKRGDFHCMGPGDVVRARTRGEMIRAFRRFRERRIMDVVVQEHMEGDVVKFYGVADGSYFSAFLLSQEREDITHRADHLRVLADRAARVVGLEVFGGDAIITPDDRVFLIDLNGWPSFACCRQPAAKGIASYVAGIVEEGFDGLSVPY